MMKRYIQSAEDSGIGTKYYRCNKFDILAALKEENILMTEAIVLDGLSAIDVTARSLPGSKVIDSYLYICVTDNEDILVNDQYVDPEVALDEYSVEDLSDYIVPADPEIIVDQITPYEVSIDINRCANSLIRDGSDFTDVLEAYDELPGFKQKGD